MRDFRLKSLEYFEARPMPSWGGDLSGIDERLLLRIGRPRWAKSWEDLPAGHQADLGPAPIRAERKFLAGVGARGTVGGRYLSRPTSRRRACSSWTDMDSKACAS